MLPLWGVVFSMIAVVYPTQDHFFWGDGTATRIITRAGDPTIYWAGESVIVLLALTCLAGAFYLWRR
jgi:hypothetical protein